METKLHWERIYTSKKSEEFSWTQDTPATSISFLKGFNVPKSAPIIDVGGGESKLVDNLLNEGYTDVTVLDISEKALDRAKARLGDNASKVNWIVSDVTEFVPKRQYTIWHDRATFHFLTEEPQIEKYVSIASGNLTGDGFMTIGTFSENKITLRVQRDSQWIRVGVRRRDIFRAATRTSHAYDGIDHAIRTNHPNALVAAISDVNISVCICSNPSRKAHLCLDCRAAITSESGGTRSGEGGDVSGRVNFPDVVIEGIDYVKITTWISTDR